MEEPNRLITNHEQKVNNSLVCDQTVIFEVRVGWEGIIGKEGKKQFYTYDSLNFKSSGRKRSISFFSEHMPSG